MSESRCATEEGAASSAPTTMGILVKPSAQIDLDHRAYLFGGYSEASGFAFASEQGSVTIISPDLKSQITFKRPGKIQSLCIHPSEPLLAIVEGSDSDLSLVELNVSLTPEAQHAGSDEEWSLNSNPEGACLFSSDGRYLWYAMTNEEEDAVEVRVLERESGSVLSRAMVDDPYGDSYISLHNTDTTDRVALWLAAGQDGQQIYWLIKDGDTTVSAVEPLMENAAPPVFMPSGNEFLTINRDYNAWIGYQAILRKYQSPSMNFLGEYQWPEGEENETSFGDSLCYVDQNYALASSSKERLFLFNLTRMTILDEVLIEGHEPKPTHVYYPSIAGDNSLCTDITQFECLRDTLVFTFRRDQGVGHVGWKDSLLFVPIAALIAQIEGAC